MADPSGLRARCALGGARSCVPAVSQRDAHATTERRRMLSEQHEQWQYERLVAQQRWPRARTEAYQAALRRRKGTSEDRERANQAGMKADR